MSFALSDTAKHSIIVRHQLNIMIICEQAHITPATAQKVAATKND
jgi:hypothetical protein